MKYYIVTNKKQELEVLSMLEDEGFMWVNTRKLPTENTVSEFPHVIIANNEEKVIMWSVREGYFKYRAVFDGRKEEKVTEVKKYKVTKEFMDKLVEWRDKYNLDATSGITLSYMVSSDQAVLPRVVVLWWETSQNPMERNNRLIAIISWLNGEDVFEVDQSNKFIVRSDSTDEEGYYTYIEVKGKLTTTKFSKMFATRFDTREEAKEWANSHQVVVEIDAEGNEV